MKMYHFVYKTTNKLNGKYYIGVHSTDNLDDGYLGSGVALQRAIDKYGAENFEREIVEMLPNRKTALRAEKRIVNRMVVEDTSSYNMTEGGLGVTQTDEIKMKISNRNAGKEPWNKGKTGLQKRPDVSLRNRVNPPTLGIPRSDETKAKISAANSGKKRTPEQNARQSEIQTGRPKTPGELEKLAESMRLSWDKRGRQHKFQIITIEPLGKIAL